MTEEEMAQVEGSTLSAISFGLDTSTVSPVATGGQCEGVQASGVDKGKRVLFDDVVRLVCHDRVTCISIRNDSPTVTPSLREVPHQGFVSLMTQPTFPKESSTEVGVNIGGIVPSQLKTYIRSPGHMRRPRGEDPSKPNSSSKRLHFDHPPVE